MKLQQFLTRLDNEQLDYSLARSADKTGVTVLINNFCEYWKVSFDEDCELESSETSVYDLKPGHSEIAIEGLFDRFNKTWTAAALNLGIEFIPDHTITGSTGEVYPFALLPSFGSAKGTLIQSHKDDGLSLDEYEAGLSEARAQGYYNSSLSPRYYYRFERSRFIETLSDWGWFGTTESRPSWLLE